MLNVSYPSTDPSIKNWNRVLCAHSEGSVITMSCVVRGWPCIIHLGMVWCIFSGTFFNKLCPSFSPVIFFPRASGCFKYYITPPITAVASKLKTSVYFLDLKLVNILFLNLSWVLAEKCWPVNTSLQQRTIRLYWSPLNALRFCWYTGPFRQSYPPHTCSLLTVLLQPQNLAT